MLTITETFYNFCHASFFGSKSYPIWLSRFSIDSCHLTSKVCLLRSKSCCFPWELLPPNQWSSGLLIKEVKIVLDSASFKRKACGVSKRHAGRNADVLAEKETVRLFFISSCLIRRANILTVHGRTAVVFAPHTRKVSLQC